MGYGCIVRAHGSHARVYGKETDKPGPINRVQWRGLACRAVKPESRQLGLHDSIGKQLLAGVLTGGTGDHHQRQQVLLGVQRMRQPG